MSIRANRRTAFFVHTVLALVLFGATAASYGQNGETVSDLYAPLPAGDPAYHLLDILKAAGIDVGFPNGIYPSVRRPVDREEFAWAIGRILPLLQPEAATTTPLPEDLATLREQMMRILPENADAVDALRRLIDDFSQELRGHAQEMAVAKDRLDALEARVAGYGIEQPLRISGALNVIVSGESLHKGTSIQDQNGRIISGNRQILGDARASSDFVLGIRGRLWAPVSAQVKLDVGNYLPGLGNAAAVGGSFAATNIYDARHRPITLWEGNLESPVDLGVLGPSDAVVGRFGEQWTQYSLMQVDADVYTHIFQTDSGNVPIDGAKIMLFPAAFTHLIAWAGRLANVPNVQPYGGTAVITPGSTQLGSHPGGLIRENHAASLRQGAGVLATFGNPSNWVLSVGVEQFDVGPSKFGPGLGSTPNDADSGHGYRVLSVYGVDFRGSPPGLPRSGLSLFLSLWTSPTASSRGRFNDSGAGWRYSSTDDQLDLSIGSLDVKGGYQYVGPDYTAPGYWGRVGAWVNPTNVEGPVASAKLRLSPRLNVNADCQEYQSAFGGARSGGGPINSPLQAGDRLNRYQIGIGYEIAKYYSVDAGYEMDDWNLKRDLAANPTNTLLTAGKPSQRWVTVDIQHSFSSTLAVGLEYQMTAYRDKGTGFGGDDADGNVAVCQFQVKF